MNFYVYIYLDPRKYQYGEYSFDYEPFYVGKGKDERCYVHLNIYGKNHYKNNKIKKILFEGHDLKKYIIKVDENLSEQEAFELEIKLISLIGRKNDGPLTNLTDGGEGMCGYKFSDETKKKMSESATGKIMSIESRKKMSKAKKGKNFSKNHKEKISKGNKNKFVSDETKKKMSESAKRKYENIEERIKISKSLKGKKKSKETKKKMSEAKKGQTSPNKGKSFSEEHKRKISEALKNKKYEITCYICQNIFIAKSNAAKYCNNCIQQQIDLGYSVNIAKRNLKKILEEIKNANS